jgi:voltage-gated potassium channel
MIKRRTFQLLQKGSHGSKINLIFDYAVMTLILMNVVAIILETIPEIKHHYGNYLWNFEVASVIIFSLEYLFRIYISDLTHPSTGRLKSAMKFIFSAYGLIDLFAVLPFFLPFLIKIDLRFLRIIRLMRFIRVFKINRYNNALTLIWSVVQEKKTELAITVFLTLLILLIAAFLMFFVEGDAQPIAFPNILASFWWTISTLTTVGSGDIHPITGLGKAIGILISLLGIGIIALPTGLISAGFMEKIEKKKNEIHKCPHCGKEFEV